MCLDRLDDKVRPYKKNGKIYAWKVFEKNGREFISNTKGNGNSMKPGRWLNEIGFRNFKSQKYLTTSNWVYSKYQIGFHSFCYKGGASYWSENAKGIFPIIKRVQLKDIVATGWQDDYPVVVAKKMKIL